MDGRGGRSTSQHLRGGEREREREGKKTSGLGSLDGKAARLLDSLSELLVHLLIGRVSGQIEAIETRVRLGQILWWSIDQMDSKQSRPRSSC